MLYAIARSRVFLDEKRSPNSRARRERTARAERRARALSSLGRLVRMGTREVEGYNEERDEVDRLNR